MDTKVLLIVGSEGLLGRSICRQAKKVFKKIICVDVLKKKRKNYYHNSSNNLDNEEIFYNDLLSYEKPDYLVNCSYPKFYDWKNMKFDLKSNKRFIQNYRKNLESTLILSKIFCNFLKKKKKPGKLVNFGSIYGFQGQDLNIYEGTKMTENIAYSISKSAIINFTRQMASYYGKYSINVNCVSPGGVLDNKMNKNFKKNYINKVPIKRFANANEISNLIIFLLSSGASYIHGANIVIDGGWSIV